MMITFGDLFLWNGNIGGYKHYRKNSLQFFKISILAILLLSSKIIPRTGKNGMKISTYIFY